MGAGLGDKLAFIFQALGSFFGGIIVGFFYVWQLGLLIVGCAPIIIIVGGIGQRVSEKVKIKTDCFVSCKFIFVKFQYRESHFGKLYSN